MFAAVRGGCALAALYFFKDFQSTHSYHLDETNHSTNMHSFYEFCIRPQYWLRGLITSSEMEKLFGKPYYYKSREFYIDSDEEAAPCTNESECCHREELAASCDYM